MVDRFPGRAIDVRVCSIEPASSISRQNYDRRHGQRCKRTARVPRKLGRRNVRICYIGDDIIFAVSFETSRRKRHNTFVRHHRRITFLHSSPHFTIIVSRLGNVTRPNDDRALRQRSNNTLPAKINKLPNARIGRRPALVAVTDT